MLPEGWRRPARRAGRRSCETTVGRVIFNEAFPDEFEYRNHHVLKADVARLVDEASTGTTARRSRSILDNLKNLGFHYATRAGVTIGIEDVDDAAGEGEDPGRAREARAEKMEDQYRKGIITDDERRQELIEIWTEATDEVKDAMEAQFTDATPST